MNPELNTMIKHTGVTVVADDGVLLVSIPEDRKNYKKLLLKYMDALKEEHKCTRYEMFITDKVIREDFKATNFDHKIVKDEEQFLHALTYFKDKVAFDFETSGLDTATCEIYSCGFSDGETTIYVPCVPVDGSGSVSVSTLMYGLRQLIDRGVKLIVHNAKYELKILRRYGINLTSDQYIDTMIMSHVVDSGRKKGLKYLVKDLLHIKMTDYDDVTGRGKKRVQFKDVPLEKAAEYCSADAFYTHELYKLFLDKMDKKDRALMHHENDIMNIAIKMEEHGILLDTDHFKRLEKEAHIQLDIIQDEVVKVIGRDINLASPKQLGELLFDELKLSDKPKKTKTGYCTDYDVLMALGKAHPDNPLVNLIVEHRKLSKLAGTYYNLYEKISPLTGMLHAIFNTLGTVSGRFSSSNPNLQNLPKGLVRAGIIAPEGWSILTFDYSQIELRVLAFVIHSVSMINAFIEKQDPHTITASKIFGIPVEDIKKDGFERAAGKTLNFALIYMQGPKSTAEQLDVTTAQAQEFMDKYFAGFPDVKPAIDKYIEKCKQLYYSETVGGRKRHLHKIKSRNFSDRTSAEREAFNHMIQGTAAEILRCAMVEIDRYLDTTETCKMIMQVHDELVFICKDEDIELHKGLITQIMQDPTLPFDFNVPLEVDVGIGKNYAEAK